MEQKLPGAEMDILMLKAKPIATAEAMDKQVQLGRPTLKSKAAIKDSAPPDQSKAVDQPEKEVTRKGPKTPENLLDLFSGIAKQSGNSDLATTLGKPDVKSALQDMKMPPSVDDLTKVLGIFGVTLPQAVQQNADIQVNQKSVLDAIGQTIGLSGGTKQFLSSLVNMAVSTPLPAANLIDMARTPALPYLDGPKPTPVPAPVVGDGATDATKGHIALGGPVQAGAVDATKTIEVTGTGTVDPSGRKFDIKMVSDLNLTAIHSDMPQGIPDPVNGGGTILGRPDPIAEGAAAGTGVVDPTEVHVPLGRPVPPDPINGKGYNGGPLPVEHGGPTTGPSLKPGFQPTVAKWHEANDTNPSGGSNKNNVGPLPAEGKPTTGPDLKPGFQPTVAKWHQANDTNPTGGSNKNIGGPLPVEGKPTTGPTLKPGFQPTVKAWHEANDTQATNGGNNLDVQILGRPDQIGNVLTEVDPTVIKVADKPSDEEKGVVAVDDVSPTPAPTTTNHVAGAPEIKVANKAALPKETFDSVAKQVSDRIESMVMGRKSGTVTVKLNPFELGSITLTVKSFGSKIDAQVKASNDDVRAALSFHKNDLLNTIESRGLTMNSFNVGQESGQPAGNQSGNQTNFTEAQRNAQLQVGLTSAQTVAPAAAAAAYGAKTTAVDYTV